MKRAVIFLAVLVFGCQDKPADPRPHPQVESAKLVGPSDEAGVLAELAPMPEGAVELRYEIDAPGGLEGVLVVIQAPGGWRSERWTMSPSDAELQVSGRTITTPRVRWTATGEQPGERSEVPLGALADAWLALPPERRDAALTHLRDWRAELAKSRLEQPGEVEIIQGVRCVKMRIAAQNLCLWEEPGLLMRYEGAAFELRVTKVIRNPTIPADEFELPAQAKDAKQVALAPGDAIDAAALIAGLAEGKVGPIAALLVPGMRLPALPSTPAAVHE